MKKKRKRRIDWYSIGLLLLFLFGILAQASQASSLSSTSTYTNPEGLIGYWDMTNSTGGCGVATTTTDKSDFTNTGTLTNGVVQGFGKYGCATIYDGVNDYTVSTNNVGVSGAGARTVCMWVKPNTTTQNGKAIINFGAGVNHNTWFLRIRSSGVWDLLVGGYTTITFGTTSTSWTHLCVSYDGATTYGYQNGIFITSGNDALVTTATPLYIGSYQGVSDYFNGTIDEVKIWNRALSAEEVYVDYLGTYANIEAYYQSLTTGNITAVGVNVTSANNSINAVGANLINAQAYILGNMSSNFTATNLKIDYLNGNMSANFSYTNGQVALILANQTFILANMSNNFTYTNGLINLVLGNQTFILGNETDIKALIAYLDANMSGNFTEQENLMGANFTATNELISNLEPTCNYNPEITEYVLNITNQTVNVTNQTVTFNVTNTTVEVQNVTVEVNNQTINITENNTNTTYNYTMPFNLTKEQAKMIADADWQLQYEKELQGYESAFASEQKKALYISVAILILVVFMSGCLVYYVVKRRRR